MTQLQVTLSDEFIENLADEICAPGFPESYSFQYRGNRDAVAMRVRQRGGKVRRWSIANQSIDPRYTIEGQDLPDKGLGNDRIMTNLYKLERTL
jgi:hypothetical protein